MIHYLVFRLAQSLMLMLGALFLVFFMVRLTGDPVALMLPKEAGPEQRAAFRTEMGLDGPLWEQFYNYLASLVRGDLGLSLSTRQPNLELIWQRLPATLELALAALLLVLVMAVPLGLIAGFRPATLVDRLVQWLAFSGQVVPSFLLAMLLILLFAVELGWLPSFGRDNPASLILPALALGLAGFSQLVRLVRASVLEVRGSDFVRTAKGKGLNEFWIATKHVLPNVTIPLVSVLGIQFTYLLGGSIYIETIFAWPGLGSLLNTAIQDADFPLVQAITLFLAFFAITVQLLGDLLYAWLDPRVKLG
jgi:peptide/nickel transport system permease protein